MIRALLLLLPLLVGCRLQQGQEADAGGALVVCRYDVARLTWDPAYLDADYPDGVELLSPDDIGDEPLFGASVEDSPPSYPFDHLVEIIKGLVCPGYWLNAGKIESEDRDDVMVVTATSTVQREVCAFINRLLQLHNH